jgi:hypothetical protein
VADSMAAAWEEDSTAVAWEVEVSMAAGMALAVAAEQWVLIVEADTTADAGITAADMDTAADTAGVVATVGGGTDGVIRVMVGAGVSDLDGLIGVGDGVIPMAIATLRITRRILTTPTPRIVLRDTPARPTTQTTILPRPTQVQTCKVIQRGRGDLHRTRPTRIMKTKMEV